MKKLKKNDLKKLAMLGIAGGTILATQGTAEAADLNNYDNMLAFAGCQNHGCGGSGGSTNSNSNSNSGNPAPGVSTPKTSTNSNANPNSEVSYNSRPFQASYYYSDNATQQGCSAQQRPQGQQQMSSGNSQQRPQMSAGCNAQQRPQWQQQGQQQMSAGCNAQQRPQWQQGQQQMSAGCNAQRAQWQQPQQQMSSGCGAQQRPQWQQAQQQMSSGCGAQQRPQGQRDTYTADVQNNRAAPAPAPTDDQSVQKPATTQQTSYRNANRSYTADASKPQTKLSESDLLAQLNDQGKATYQSLDSAGKALAMKLANQTCKGQNDCKGLNACKTEKNSCAGQGNCAGTSPGPFKDKNLAVKVAANKMAAKRANTASPS